MAGHHFIFGCFIVTHAFLRQKHSPFVSTMHYKVAFLHMQSGWINATSAQPQVR